MDPLIRRMDHFRLTAAHFLAHDKVRTVAFPLMVILVAAFYVLRIYHLGADFTTDYAYTRDGVLLTDEGWYSANAMWLLRTGEWYRDGDLNFAVNLPVLQWMHLVSFIVLLGPSIIAARMTIVVSLGVLLWLVYTILARHADRWTALVACLWLSTNYFFYLYSRIALGEIPMTVWATAGLLLASLATTRRGWLAAVGSGACIAAAYYTKSSAIFALPLAVAIIVAVHWWPRDGAQRRFPIGKLLAFFITIAVIVGAHFHFIAFPRWEDYQYFLTLNVGMNAETDPGEVATFGLKMLDHVKLVDKVMYAVIVYTTIPLLVFSRSYRRDPLVWLSIAWIAIYMGMFSFYVNFRPRYWVGMATPFAMLVALGLRHFVLLAQANASHPSGLRRNLPALAAALYVVALLGSAGRSIGETAHYLRNVSYSFAEFAAQVDQVIDEDPRSRGYLLGHFADTIALYENVKPINDRFAPKPLEYRLRKHQPRYLVTESTAEERDFLNQWEMATAETGGVRATTFEGQNIVPEMIGLYPVLDEYKGWPLGLYRLRRRVYQSSYYDSEGQWVLD